MNDYENISSVFDNTTLNDSVSCDYTDPKIVYYPDFTQMAPVKNTFIVLHLIVMVLTIGGNALVCVTVFSNKHMHTVVNYFIVNLSVCDLLVGLFVLPAQLLELTAPASWALMDNTICTMTRFLQNVLVFCSVLTLVAICVERYVAIVDPFKAKIRNTERRAKIILVVVWLVTVIMCAPMLYPSIALICNMQSEYGEFTRLKCFDNFSNLFRTVYFFLLFVVIYVLPLTFIAGTCIQIVRVLIRGIPDKGQRNSKQREGNRRKVAKMVIVVVVAFVFCWTPYFMVNIVTQVQEISFMHKGQFFFTMLTLNFLAFLNSCVNPFIYAAMSAKFRDGFVRFARLLLCMPTTRNNSQMNTSLMSHRSAAASFSDNSMEHGGSGRKIFFPSWRGISRMRSLSRASRRTLSLSLRSGGRSRVGSVNRGSTKLNVRPINPNTETTTLMLNGNMVRSISDNPAHCPCRIVDTIVLEKDIADKQVTIVASSDDCGVVANNGNITILSCVEYTELVPTGDGNCSPIILMSQSFPNLSSEASSISSEESRQEWPSTKRLVANNKTAGRCRRSNSDSIIKSTEEKSSVSKS